MRLLFIIMNYQLMDLENTLLCFALMAEGVPRRACTVYRTTFIEGAILRSAFRTTLLYLSSSHVLVNPLGTHTTTSLSRCDETEVLRNHVVKFAGVSCSSISASVACQRSSLSIVPMLGVVIQNYFSTNISIQYTETSVH